MIVISTISFLKDVVHILYSLLNYSYYGTYQNI